jgi:lipopolysaccharide export LptBFGC system permease protein LptF
MRDHSLPRADKGLRKLHRSAVWMMLLSLSLASGCRRAPSIGIYGSYFPGWLICLAFGIALTVAAHLGLRRLDYEVHLWPLGLVFISLSITLTCLLWLIFFY